MKTVPYIQTHIWNELVDKISRRLPINFVFDKRPTWSHPWKISPKWDNDGKQWVFTIKPGFVNGIEVTTPTRVKYANSRTIERLKEAGVKNLNDDRVVDAFICESPQIEIGSTRIIGTGANPTGISSNLRLSYEPVPQFFKDLGVGESNVQISGSLSGGITFKDGPDEGKKVRRLRACDVSLWKDRPSAKFEIYNGSILDGSMGSVYITYNHSGGMRKNPYLQVSAEFNPPPEPDSVMALLDGMTDPEYDLLKVATIYFLSPEGASEEAELDSSWTPFVKNDIFWNLAHSPQRIPDPTPIEPIRLITPLAFGIASPTIAMILSPFNDLLNRAAQILMSRNLAGKFWSL